MLNNLSPGMSIKETDFSFYVRQRSTTACGMMGIAERGPVNKPTLVTSWEQFIKRFGRYHQTGYLAYAARAFFDNGGQQLWVNRVCHYSDITDRTTQAATKSSVTLKDRSGTRAYAYTGTPDTDRILWRALHPGLDGNDITVTLVASGAETPLSVAVAGSDITVNLQTDEYEDSISTVAEVLAAVADSSPASALVTASSTDTGVVAAAAETGLDDGTAAQDSLHIQATDEGVWGDGLTVEVQNGTRNPAAEFNIIVRLNNLIVETYRDVSLAGVVQALGRSEYVQVIVQAVSPLANNKRPEIGTYSLTGGDDGLTSLSDTDYIGDQAAHTGLYAFDDIFDLSLLTLPGVTSGNVLNAAFGYAELRQDVFVIADMPIGTDREDALAFRRGTGEHTHAAFNSSYGAMYWPWLIIEDPVTRLDKRIPPSGAVAGCFVRSDQKARLWAAPAGPDRGRIFNVLGIEHLTQRADRDVLYPEGINVIATFPDSGVTIWGQRTLQQQASATDRVNVRRLMIWLEKSIGSATNFVTFQPNLPETWRALLRVITPFLRGVKDDGGVYDFRVQCDEETNPPAVQDRNEIVARVFVKPTKTAEFGQIEFVMTDSGANFSEIFNG